MARVTTTSEGGSRELLTLAWPLIVSASFWTLQIFVDRILLSWHEPAEVGAAMAAAILFWVPMSLGQGTAGYVTTFVAQYLGAEQPERVGEIVWQAMFFSFAAGLMFLLLLPGAQFLIGLGGNDSHLQALQVSYLRALAFSGLPTLINITVCSFFAGRGASHTVLLINSTGLAINAFLAYFLISGSPRWGIPAMGIVGAGWATVAGSSASALLGMCLMLRPHLRKQYRFDEGFGFRARLFRRLMYFGLPNGLSAALDPLVFTFFAQLVGRLGPAPLAATSITFTLNMLVILPTVGIGQAVEVLVGRRLGENRPDVAARSAWTGLVLALLFTAVVAVYFLLAPSALLALFEGGESGVAGNELREEVRSIVPYLLRFVVVYCLFDTVNIVFSFALRGAGDTRFVTWSAMIFAWPAMIFPTWAAVEWGWGLYWAWAFSSFYIFLLGMAFLARFLQGKWRSMRVIEAVPNANASGGAWQAVQEMSASASLTEAVLDKGQSVP